MFPQILVSFSCLALVVQWVKAEEPAINGSISPVWDLKELFRALFAGFSAFSFVLGLFLSKASFAICGYTFSLVLNCVVVNW